MDIRRILGLAVVLAALFLALARPWEAPVRREKPGAAAPSGGQGEMRWDVRERAYLAVDAGEPAAPAVPVAMPPSGFCDGEPGPPGFERPSATRAAWDLLGNAAHAEDVSDSTQRAVQQAQAALSERDPGRALQLARAAVSVDAGPKGVHAVLGLVARRTGHPFEAAAALERACRMEPMVPALERELAEALALSHRLPDALLHVRRYLEAVPQDWDAQRKARLWEVGSEVEAGFVDAPDAMFPARYDPAVPASRVARLQQAMRDALPRVTQLLGPLEDPVAVLVYRERADLLATTCAQGWAHAVFDGRMRFQDEEGGLLRREDGLPRVAAHELTHVLQHRNQARMDGWLVEGVARFVAHEEDHGYRVTLAALKEQGSYAPFSSLMGTLMVLEGAQDSALAYDQALMMVHWVVDRQGELGLRSLLKQRGGSGEAALAAALRLEPAALGPDFVAWLRAQPAQ